MVSYWATLHFSHLFLQAELVLDTIQFIKQMMNSKRYLDAYYIIFTFFLLIHVYVGLFTYSIFVVERQFVDAIWLTLLIMFDN